MSQVEDDVLELFRSKLEADSKVPDALIDDLMIIVQGDKLDATTILGAISNSTHQGEL